MVVDVSWGEESASDDGGLLMVAVSWGVEGA